MHACSAGFTAFWMVNEAPLHNNQKIWMIHLKATCMILQINTYQKWDTRRTTVKEVFYMYSSIPTGITGVKR